MTTKFRNAYEAAMSDMRNAGIRVIVDSNVDPFKNHNRQLNRGITPRNEHYNRASK